MPNQLSAFCNESSFNTAIWEIKNPSQPRAMYDLYMTHSDIKLGLVYDDDEISRAQNKNGSERVEKYASPSTCSFELDLQV